MNRSTLVPARAPAAGQWAVPDCCEFLNYAWRAWVAALLLLSAGSR